MYKTIIISIVALQSVVVYADDESEYSECSSYFSAMSQNQNIDARVGRRYGALGEMMDKHSKSIAGQQKSSRNKKDMALKLKKRMQKSKASKKNINDKYAANCKNLLQKIVTKTERTYR